MPPLRTLHGAPETRAQVLHMADLPSAGVINQFPQRLR
jgi:hypothetical protein